MPVKQGKTKGSMLGQVISSLIRFRTLRLAYLSSRRSRRGRNLMRQEFGRLVYSVAIAASRWKRVRFLSRVVCTSAIRSQHVPSQTTWSIRAKRITCLWAHLITKTCIVCHRVANCRRAHLDRSTRTEWRTQAPTTLFSSSSTLQQQTHLDARPWKATRTASSTARNSRSRPSETTLLIVGQQMGQTNSSALSRLISLSLLKSKQCQWWSITRMSNSHGFLHPSMSLSISTWTATRPNNSTRSI